MMFRGAGKYSKDQILKVLQCKNTQFNGCTTYENVVLQARCLFENLEQVNNVYFSMVTDPYLRENDISEESSIIQNEFENYSGEYSFHMMNSIGSFRWNLAEMLVDPSTVPLKPEDLQKRNSEVWNPSNMVIYITSCLEDNQVLDILGIWGNIKTQKDQKKVVNVSFENDGIVPYRYINFPVGSSLAVVGEIPTQMSVREGIITRIVSCVFSNGLDSRLLKELRQKRALVYGAGLGFSLSKMHNTLHFGVECNASNYLEIYQIFLSLISQPITQEEFDEVKEDLTASNIFASEDLGSTHTRMISGHMNYGKVYTEEEALSELSSITLDEVVEYQRKLFVPKTFSAHMVENG